ncbi:hypothetical protein VDR99_16290, partial [Xanthomonas campestris pv. campestris]|nr:hypothetical protein [Xanthomonas campestris pv. campestris]
RACARWCVTGKTLARKRAPTTAVFAWAAVFTLINAADCDASTLTALSRGRKARTQRDSIELYAPAIANARPIITLTIVGARLRAMGRSRESPRAQARSYNSARNQQRPQRALAQQIS